jgi:hypothetical protein
MGVSAREREWIGFSWCHCLVDKAKGSHPFFFWPKVVWLLDGLLVNGM